MQKIPSFSLSPIQNGIIRSSAVDDLLSPENTCQMALNLHFDQIGAVISRKGITALGGAVEDSETVLGMINYRNNAGSNYKLLAKLNTSVYSWNGSAWSTVRTTLTASSKARFTNFVDYTFMVNGNGNEVCSTYNGSGSFGSTNVASLPAGDCIENFRSRIWVASSATDKVYYSDVVSTSNTITGGTSFIQISPQDGEKITAIQRHPRMLLVFKQNHIYRIYSINSVDPDPSILMGTYSQESVIEAKDGIYYHHPTGFYKFVDGGTQQEISRPIIDIIKAIPRTYYENVSGWSDDDHLYWSIGDITLEGITFNNVVCRFTISTQIWTVYNYAVEIRSACLFDNGTTLVNVVGGNAGKVYTFDSGTSDDGSPINYDLQTHWLYLTASKSTLKSLTEIVAIHENANGCQVSYQIDNEDKNKWTPIGEIKKDLSHKFTFNSKNFVRIKFRLSGNTVGSPFIWRTFELLNLISI
ncbi:MAG: hypothetical protein COX07_02195 [Bacteroidetes bacterium CG23_combo_of_CG06-09_8_20_14_all_32_9]|nr:MAG: hypothetical protein COX07_02195 [Bacteroidetes bacterium CG23_combo_of_CG06-09_8_20_14_all_32_9]